MPRPRSVAPTEERTARLTLLIDPRKKQVFEDLCAQEDVTPSQVVRRMIRDYIEAKLGHAWSASPERPAVRASSGAPRRGPARRP
jgi:hypothetical protein